MGIRAAALNLYSGFYWTEIQFLKDRCTKYQLCDTQTDPTNKICSGYRPPRLRFRPNWPGFTGSPRWSVCARLRVFSYGYRGRSSLPNCLRPKPREVGRTGYRLSRPKWGQDGFANHGFTTAPRRALAGGRLSAWPGHFQENTPRENFAHATSRLTLL